MDLTSHRRIPHRLLLLVRQAPVLTTGRSPDNLTRRRPQSAEDHHGMQGDPSMKTYDITVTREGKWWMVAVPAIDGLTQARRLSEIRDCLLYTSPSPRDGLLS